MTLPNTVENRIDALASDLAELLAAIGQDKRYAVLSLVVTKSADMVSACDKDAATSYESWLR